MDGKWPDRATLIPWSAGWPMLWDFTCPDTFALSHLRNTSFLAGAASTAEAIKVAEYSELLTTHQFLPGAVETEGVWGQGAETFLKALGRRLIDASEDNRSSQFLRQRIDIAVQRGNVLRILVPSLCLCTLCLCTLGGVLPALLLQPLVGWNHGFYLITRSGARMVSPFSPIWPYVLAIGLYWPPSFFFGFFCECFYLHLCSLHTILGYSLVNFYYISHYCLCPVVSLSLCGLWLSSLLLCCFSFSYVCWRMLTILH